MHVRVFMRACVRVCVRACVSTGEFILQMYIPKGKYNVDQTFGFKHSIAFTRFILIMYGQHYKNKYCIICKCKIKQKANAIVT